MAGRRRVQSADEWYFGVSQWKPELARLREIVLDIGFEESVKWFQPCYSVDGRNVVIVSAIKQAATLNFFQGALLDDPGGRLVVPGENTHAGRYLQYASVDDINADEAVIRAFLHTAMENERAGKRVPEADKPETPVPAELTEVLENDPPMAAAFAALTPGRQRAYALFINQAKKSETRTSRALGYRDRILAGKGPNDCICGLSKKMPGCDGSHKALR